MEQLREIVKHCSNIFYSRYAVNDFGCGAELLQAAAWVQVPNHFCHLTLLASAALLLEYESVAFRPDILALAARTKVR